MIESHRTDFSFTVQHHGNALLFENKNNPECRRQKYERILFFVLSVMCRPILAQLIIRSLCSSVSIFTESNNSYKTNVLIFLSVLNMYMYGFCIYLMFKLILDADMDVRDVRCSFSFNCLSPYSCEVVQHVFQVSYSPNRTTF